MNVLIPKFHPLALLVCFAFYVLCLLEGGEVNPDFVRAELFTAIGLGVVAATSIYGAVSANNRQKDALAQSEAAMELQAEQEAQRRADVEKAYGPQAEKAQKRLSKGKYGLSKSREREIGEETGRATDALLGSQLAELERGDEGRVFSGRREALKRGLMKSGLDTVAETRLGSARFSEELAENQRLQDISIKQNYGSLLAGLPPSQLPGMAQNQAAMMAGMPTAGERFGQLGIQGMQAAATLGAFDKKEPTVPAADTPVDQAAATDTVPADIVV